MRKRRHPWRGLIGGILLGIALALGSIMYSFNALGPSTPLLMLLLGIAIGIVLVFVPRPWGRRPPPASRAAG